MGALRSPASAVRRARTSGPRLALSLTVVLAACATPTPRAKTDSTLQVPAAIAVPSGNRMVFMLRATGSQNYECRAATGTGGDYDWVATAPEAALYDRSDSLVGRHYGGPTWEYGDDSKVTGKVVAEAPATEPASVGWLLLQGTPAPRTGVMSGVTYVQRVNTNGGAAPSDVCDARANGAKKAVRYSADYLFYKH